jgi:hypothetical protein
MTVINGRSAAKQVQTEPETKAAGGTQQSGKATEVRKTTAHKSDVFLKDGALQVAASESKPSQQTLLGSAKKFLQTLCVAILGALLLIHCGMPNSPDPTGNTPQSSSPDSVASKPSVSPVCKFEYENVSSGAVRSFSLKAETTIFPVEAPFPFEAAAPLLEVRCGDSDAGTRFGIDVPAYRGKGTYYSGTGENAAEFFLSIAGDTYLSGKDCKLTVSTSPEPTRQAVYAQPVSLEFHCVLYLRNDGSRVRLTSGSVTSHPICREKNKEDPGWWQECLP